MCDASPSRQRFAHLRLFLLTAAAAIVFPIAATVAVNDNIDVYVLAYAGTALRCATEGALHAAAAAAPMHVSRRPPHSLSPSAPHVYSHAWCLCSLCQQLRVSGKLENSMNMLSGLPACLR